MRTGFFKSRLLAWLALLLGVAFIATGGIAYMAASDAIRSDYARRSMPALAALAQAELQRDLRRLADSSESIAGDAFLANWLNSGERDESLLAKRIKEAESRYALSGSEVSSLRTQKRYRAGPRQEQAAFPLLPATAGKVVGGIGYRINPHPDPNDIKAFAIQAERPVLGENGGVIATVVTGLTREHLLGSINRFRSSFGVDVRLVDRSGIVLAGNDAMRHLREMEGFSELLPAILAGDEGSHPAGRATLYFASRPIAELDALLLVTGSDEASIGPQWRAFTVNLAIAGGAILLVLLSVAGAFEYYRRALVEGPGLDPLTGLINRSAYEFVFRQTILETARSNEPLSLMLIEVDAFDRLIKTAGAPAADRVLSEIAGFSKAVVRVSDPVARWEANQFVIQLRDCPLDKAVAAGERLRQRVLAHTFAPEGENPGRVTISLGVATLGRPDEDAGDFLRRLEKTLNQALSQGGNRVES